MFATKKSSSGSTHAKPGVRSVSLEASRAPCEALDKPAIGELSGALIEQMTQEELVRLISASDLLTLRLDERLLRRLPFYDCETLRRLAHLARRCCQNQSH